MPPPPVYKTVVVGLGETGLSCARYLCRAGRSFAITDTRQAPPGLETLRRELPQTPLFLGGLNEPLLRAAEELIVSPGLDLQSPGLAGVRKRRVPVFCDVELFCRQVRQQERATIVALTGTNGKSTTIELLAQMALKAGRRVGLGGNMGKPALDLLTDYCELYLLELSSFQLETISSLNAEVAAVLNVTPDHLDRHGDMDCYASIKQRIYAGDGTQVINLDDPRVAAMRLPKRRHYTFTLHEPDSAQGFGLRWHAKRQYLAQGHRLLMPVDELRMHGRHNAANALAAVAMGTALELPEPALLAALRDFTGLAHRAQWVACHGGVNWYNDSKATNAAAAAAAVSGLGGKQNLLLIAGGEAKSEDFSALAQAGRGRLKAAILLGRDAALLECCLREQVSVQRAQDLQHAVELARRQAEPGDIVLLSPGCASFDMFRDYRERGEEFSRLVRMAALQEERCKVPS